MFSFLSVALYLFQRLKQLCLGRVVYFSKQLINIDNFSPRVLIRYIINSKDYNYVFMWLLLKSSLNS